MRYIDHAQSAYDYVKLVWIAVVRQCALQGIVRPKCMMVRSSSLTGI